MWIKIASKTENATFDTDFPIMSDISLLWIVFAKALKSLNENYNLFVTSKKWNHEFTNSPIKSASKCLYKPLKWKSKA